MLFFGRWFTRRCFCRFFLRQARFFCLSADSCFRKRFFLGHSLFKFIHPSRGINKLLFAGKKRVAVWAYFNVNIFNGWTHLRYRAARAGYCCIWIICWVNICFHKLSYYTSSWAYCQARCPLESNFYGKPRILLRGMKDFRFKTRCRRWRQIVRF